MNDLNELLGATEEPKKIKIFDKDGTESSSSVGDNIAESVLAVVAYTILVAGIIASLVWGIVVGSGYDGKTLLGWGIFFGGSITSLVTWATCMVIVNISNNIRQIKHDLRNNFNTK